MSFTHDSDESHRAVSRRRRSLRPGLAVAIVLLTAGYPAAAPEPLSRELKKYVLVASEDSKIKDFIFDVAGNVGVNDVGGTLRWGRRSFFGDGTQVASDVVTKISFHSSLWDLFVNTITKPPQLAEATIRNQGPTPFGTLPIIVAMPDVLPCTPGVASLTVPREGSDTIGAGDYGAVTLQDGATLTFEGGTYCLASIKGGKRVQLLFAAPSEINVLGNVKVSSYGIVGPAEGSGMSSQAIQFKVAGDTVKLSHVTRTTAVFSAPNAVMNFGKFGHHHGQYLARRIRVNCCNAFTLESCGSGVIDLGEECDDGNDNDGDACKTDCTPNVCGDAVVHSGVEECDDGNSDDADACKNDCTLNICGDGVTRTGVEACDDGNTNEHDACKNDCTLNACGDGVVHTGVEQCDDANGDQCDGCTSLCIFTVLCGDGIRECSEQCDDGNHDACDGCAPDCKFERCGDGTACAPEQCDDGNLNESDACKNDCTANVCGDGVVRTGVEVCDDGNSDEHDACKNDCTLNVCGDGAVRTGVEDCDDGNSDDCDGCTAACTFTPQCGDGTAQCNEDCDDGNHDACDGCAPDCKFEGCGDGNVCAPEVCEPPGTPDCAVNCQAQVAPGNFCTLSQGSFGASGGAANGPDGLITRYPEVLPVSAGSPGSPPSVTVDTQVGLIAFLPTKSSPNQLCGNAMPSPCPGDLVIGVPADVPDPSGTGSEGYGGGVLTGQTLALSLAVKLSNIGATPSGFGSVRLPRIPFCTCDAQGAKAGPFSIPSSVIDAADTVGDLVALGNQALRGVSLDDPLTYLDLADAMDLMITAFHGCREGCSCN